MGAGGLLLIADMMQAGRSALHEENFVKLKEHLFGLPQISALFTSSTISSEMIEQGIEFMRPGFTYLDILIFRDTSHSRCSRGFNQSR